ncbi:MAG: UvrD-helicase domain-containing protein, partial [Clostridiales bacterium]|nr:UvrD-helicase domain-containing protein [Clostridiales bacterium]
MNFTNEQLLAINTEGNMLVSASAGSGKTTVMIQRILRLLKSGVQMNEIFVSTFTNASALDMRTKLKRELINYDSIVDNLHQASIGTFHSLCSKLIRKFFYAVDIDPDFALMDEKESDLILQECIEQIVQETNRNPTQDYLSLYNVLLLNRTDRALRQQIAKIYYFSRTQVNDSEWLLKASNSHAKPQNFIVEYQKKRESKLQSLKAQLLQFQELARQVELDFGIYVTELLDFLDGRACTLSTLSKKKCKFCEKTSGFIYNRQVEVYEQFKDFKLYFKSKAEKLNLEICDPELALPFVLEILRLTELSAQRYERKKQQVAKLDFADIEHKMLKVLENSDTRQLILSEIKYLFVDEYQDINPLQDKILSMLGQNAQIFIVGDVKQSIYSFRMCDPKFFIQKLKDSTLQQVNLNGNFRSRIEILDFVNSVFAPVMTTDWGGADYSQDSMLSGGNNSIPASFPIPSKSAVVCKIVKNEQIDASQ